MTSGAPPDERDENIGRVLSQKYELIRLLGRGGMGAVYEGRNKIGKRVAVKLLLKPTFTQNLELTARFFREAQASAAAESKHVVDVYDTGVDAESGLPYIIMAYLSGEDLEHVVRRVGALNPVSAVRIVSQAATGLAKAHAAGIVHRDIKPANLFLAIDEGEAIVKVLDFGIAKVTVESGLDAAGADGHALTQTGALLGTPLYMSPEQAQGLKTIDARTDVWSLGMCLYEALAGRMPFADVDTIGKLIVAIVAQDVTPLTSLAPWVRPELAAVVHQALARDASARIATARELIAALQPFTSGSLAIATGSLVGVQGALDVTLPPGEQVAIAPSAVPAAREETLPSPRTTGAVAAEARPALPEGAPRAPLRGALVAGAVVLVIAGAGVVTKTLLRGRSEPAMAPQTAQSSSTTPSASPSVPPMLASAASNDADLKVGFLTLKIPAGYTVKVDGVNPGAPGNEAAPHPVKDGRLELRGEFQRKFLVAVLDETGKRKMVQDVYLYDNKLDPESLDSSAGPVKVDKPRTPATRKSASQGDAASPATATATATASAGADLPPRF